MIVDVETRSWRWWLFGRRQGYLPTLDQALPGKDLRDGTKTPDGLKRGHGREG